MAGVVCKRIGVFELMNMTAGADSYVHLCLWFVLPLTKAWHCTEQRSVTGSDADKNYIKAIC